ncbi:MAG TPA: glycosyltransferase family 4 protein [Thermoanaerobaculia bacterium]|nr:glycosyltransferase family 4 protein [Thermoanaerobaculia bacterium]
MRVLLVSHPPLTAELGAPQIVLSLATALRARGHDALAWSPEPLPSGAGGRTLWKRQLEALESFAAEQGPFDVIDTPAITAGRNLERQGSLVVRSIQPELLYLWQDIRGELGRRLPPTPRSVAHALIAAPRAAAILTGWRRARLILCMGSIELSWMVRRFPRWRPKLGSYVCAPSPAERPALAEVRRRRPARPEGEGLRFLWIGRWAAHKGTGRLVRWIAERVAAAPGDTFTLAGCGPAAERDLRPEWLRTGKVRLVPFFPRTELPLLLASHDAGLFTSTVEGWGLTLNEMLESGMPVFATQAGGVADLAPFFSQSLRPFPPPVRIEPWPLREDLEANGYFARFDWTAIAGSYEEAVRGLRLHGH